MLFSCQDFRQHLSLSSHQPDVAEAERSQQTRCPSFNIICIKRDIQQICQLASHVEHSSMNPSPPLFAARYLPLPAVLTVAELGRSASILSFSPPPLRPPHFCYSILVSLLFRKSRLPCSTRWTHLVDPPGCWTSIKTPSPPKNFCFLFYFPKPFDSPTTYIHTDIHTYIRTHKLTFIHTHTLTRSHHHNVPL